MVYPYAQTEVEKKVTMSSMHHHTHTHRGGRGSITMARGGGGGPARAQIYIYILTKPVLNASNNILLRVRGHLWSDTNGGRGVESVSAKVLTYSTLCFYVFLRTFVQR